MSWDTLEGVLATAPIAGVALAVFLALVVCAGVGVAARRWRDRTRAGTKAERAGDQDTYVVSAVLGLLALLLGFTFSLAVQRFEARRELVVVEANAIGTTYLRAQLLPEPHRTRMSRLLVLYTDNRIALARAGLGRSAPLLQVNDALLTDIWAATAAAFDSVRELPFTTSYLETVNNLIDQDAARKAARTARIPAEVIAILFVYMLTTAGVLGYVLAGLRGQVAAVVLLALLTLSLALIIDIDRPTAGGVVESQGPMLALRQSLAAQPPAVFDRWRTPGP